VRVLRSDDELQEAIGRALGYDYVAEEALHRRIDRYTKSDTPHVAAAIDLSARGNRNTERSDRRTVTDLRSHPIRIWDLKVDFSRRLRRIL